MILGLAIEWRIMMKDIKYMLVIGSGIMGSGIAQVIAEAGIKVYLNDISEEIIQKNMSGIVKRWDSKLSKGKIDEETYQKYLSNLEMCVDYTLVSSQIDMVVEAASENIDIKNKIFTKLSDCVSEDTIIASNTSSISITKLAANVKNPSRFIGTHFFSPVPVMKLLEVIPGLLTNQDTIDSVLEWGKSISKVCIVAKDSVGFIVNRLLDPMLNDAIRMVDEGIGTVDDIDKGMKFGCAHPMGPLELADMAGLDVLYAVMQVFHAQTGNPAYAPAPLLRKLVESGYYGKKVGKGLYTYGSDGTKKSNTFN